MFAARFFCSHTCLATRHKKGASENIYEAQTMSGFYSNWTFCRISSLKINFRSSYMNPLPRDILWSRGMCLNTPNTLLTRDWKQFQNKCSTFCTFISFSQYDSAPKMPWLIISSHTDLKLKICLSLLNLRK